MIYFRRFVIGLTEFLIILSIIVGTYGGAKLGLLLGQLAATSPGMSQQQWLQQTVSVAGVQMSMPEFLGLIIGGGMGFIIPAVTASMLFVLIEIQRSCRQTAATLMILGGGPMQDPRL